MAAVPLYASFTRSPVSTLSVSPKLCPPIIKTRFLGLRSSQLTSALELRSTSTRGPRPVLCYKNNTPDDNLKKEIGSKVGIIFNPPMLASPAIELAEMYEDNAINRRILERWDVPWNWQTISLTPFACGLSCVLTETIEAAALQYLCIDIWELSLDETAEILLLSQGITTIVVLAVLYSLTKSFSPLPDDIYQYDWREPFDLKKGWLLYAGVGLGGAVAAIAITSAAMSFFNGGVQHREIDALTEFLPLIGSSTISTACLVGIAGVLAPILEETVFRGFLMVSLTKWLPTPLAVLISAAAFAGAHFTPGQFPILFVFGVAVGLCYAHTRNLLTPIVIHAVWNSGIIFLLTFLK
ncbi:hypothetical protein OROHE_019356 [Orobanche hederae]